MVGRQGGQSGGELVPGRYSHARAVGEVEHLRQKLGLTQRQVAQAVGLTDPEYSQKKRGEINSFSLDEFGRICEYLSQVSGRPLIGFPFLDRTLQTIVDRKVSGWQENGQPPEQ